MCGYEDGSIVFLSDKKEKSGVIDGLLNEQIKSIYCVDEFNYVVAYSNHQPVLCFMTLDAKLNMVRPEHVLCTKNFIFNLLSY